VDHNDFEPRATKGGTMRETLDTVSSAFTNLIVCLTITAFSSVAQPQALTRTGGDLSGSGDVMRSTVTRQQMFDTSPPLHPLDDGAAFALPVNAAGPADNFEGTLTLRNLSKGGRFVLHSDIFQIVSAGDSEWKHLPEFSFQFVQSESYLVPAVQGLVITGSPAWNYILGPGRVWRENRDDGYSRASFPFALVQRNQNCVHNGEMTFLFSNTKSPRVSNVYYQITQETCYPMKFDMWGTAEASYAPGAVAGSDTLKQDHATEIRNRMATKPLSALAADFHKSGVNLTAFSRAYKHPEDLTTYGVAINGVNYTAGCRTRSGEYAFCDDMRLPSYSIAKSMFAGVALMRLGQLYGTGVYNELIKNFIPEKFIQGKWDATTFNHASDMATGNYNLDGYEADEDSPAMDPFLVDESYAAKLVDAFALKKSFAPPGTKWVYQSSATFVLTQAMNSYLKQRQGNAADLFNLVRDDVYKRLHVSAGGLTTIRTDNSATGAPSGYYGLFLNKDDVAKIGSFLNKGDGVIESAPILEATRLNEALFRSSNATNVGVPIMGSIPASTLGPSQLGSGKAPASNTRRYAHGFWGKYVTTAEFPEYSCNFWVSLMSGYGGNVVALLPNGATFYVFSDGREFLWVDSVREVGKLAPMCR
jgi:hypothetical protein